MRRMMHRSAVIKMERCKCFAVLVVLFLLVALGDQRLQASEADLQTWAERLIKSSGAVPQAILQPPSGPTTRIGFGERLRRLLHGIMGMRVTYATARGKACMANQRVILGAIEMYNLDHPAAVKTGFTHTEAATTGGYLVSGAYLKTPVTLPDAGCWYESYGNISTDGLVYCRMHGTFDEERVRVLRKVSGHVDRVGGANDSDQLFIIVSLALVSFVSIAALFVMRRLHSAAADKTAG